MACNCGGKKVTTTYRYTDPQGNVTTYNSQIEARAAQIRNGNQGTIETVTR